MSLISEAFLQRNCNKEGFNVQGSTYRQSRIGIFGNNERNCESCDSVIGFGISNVWDWSSGNINYLSGTYIKTFGYIFVQ